MQNDPLLRAHLGYLAKGNSMFRATLGFIDYANLVATATQIKFCLYLLTKQSELVTSVKHSNSIEIETLQRLKTVYSVRRRNSLNINILVEFCS